MSVHTFRVPSVGSLVWQGDELVDWTYGFRYTLDSRVFQASHRAKEDYDAVQVSSSGEYIVLYERFGTKGLIFDGQKVVRHLTRHEYRASSYECPLTLVTLPYKQEAIAYCPDAYNQIHIEVLRSGKRLTVRSGCGVDFFQSRLSVSPDQKWLLSAGWVWSPCSTVKFFSIEQALRDPNSLDKPGHMEFSTGAEITSAAFLSRYAVIVSSPNAYDYFEDPEPGDLDDLHLRVLRPGTIAIYDPETDTILSSAPCPDELGNLIGIDDRHIISLYDHPKLIDAYTGEILHRWPEVHSGRQTECHRPRHSPPITWDPVGQRLAVAGDASISIITVEVP